MEYPPISWKLENLEADLKALSDYSLSIADSARTYYQKNSRKKKSWAKNLRLVAILATALGGMLPILSQILRTYKIDLDPAWATVAITVAITAIGLDRFFGFSSAWMRFVTTEIKMEGRIEQFRLNVENEKFSWHGVAPNFEQGRSMLTIIVQFITETSDIVKDETNTWMVEFQSAIQKFNEEANVKADATKLGGLSVTIEAGEKFKNGLKIHLEGQTPVKITGASYAYNNLYPKIYQLTVSGTMSEEVDGKNVERDAKSETLVNVTAGTITTVAVKLD